jgi:23S rRNA pseudouridine2604 synthase
MATLKLKKDAGKSAPDKPARAPLRGAGAGVQKRPTLSQAQADRAEREARYQEQLRQRFGDQPPAEFARRGEPSRPEPTGRKPRPTGPSGPRRDETAAPFPSQAQARPPRERREPLPPARRADPSAAPRSGPNTAFGRPSGPSGPSGPRDTSSRNPSPRHGVQRDNAPRNSAFGNNRPAPPQRSQQRFERDDDEPVWHAEQPGSLRLSKRMSELGIASRREADEWIPKGWVRVDDQVVKELGSRVMPGQRITVDAQARHQQAQRVTVLINKPVGYVSGQAEDGYEPAYVLVKPENQWHDDNSGTRFLHTHLRGLAPAGRLDIDSVGLLVLTQDGRVAKQLIGENSEIEKEYLVRVQRPDGTPLPDSELALLKHGLELDGEPLREAQVEWVNDDQLRFVLREGKKRQIRRMCEAVGLEVLGLKRVRIGRVMLGDLPTGQWRYLRPGEAF